MAESWQIACINKGSRSDPYGSIERVGGPDGEGWTLSVDAIIAHIRKGDSFWIDVGGKRVDVIIATQSGRDYIKARCDEDGPSSLLNLPECVD